MITVPDNIMKQRNHVISIILLQTLYVTCHQRRRITKAFRDVKRHHACITLHQINNISLQVQPNLRFMMTFEEYYTKKLVFVSQNFWHCVETITGTIFIHLFNKTYGMEE